MRQFGVWRSLVAHLVWDQGVAGSNPVAPTTDWKLEVRGRRLDLAFAMTFGFHLNILLNILAQEEEVPCIQLPTSDVQPPICGCSSMVERWPSKPVTWVRFPSPAPDFIYRLILQGFSAILFLHAPVAQLDRATDF